MSDLLKEFEEDARREKREAAWREFGRYAVWISIAIVLGTAGGVSWRYWQKSQAEKASVSLIKAQESIAVGETQKAISLLEDKKLADSKLYGLIKLTHGQALSESGDEAAARQAYAQLAQKQSAGAYSKLASIAAADEALLDEPKKGSPLYHIIQEWRGWQLMAQGKKDEAVSIFTALLDDNKTPQSLRSRVTNALQIAAPQSLLPAKKDVSDAQ